MLSFRRQKNCPFELVSFIQPAIQEAKEEKERESLKDVGGKNMARYWTKTSNWHSSSDVQNTIACRKNKYCTPGVYHSSSRMTLIFFKVFTKRYKDVGSTYRGRKACRCPRNGRSLGTDEITSWGKTNRYPPATAHARYQLGTAFPPRRGSGTAFPPRLCFWGFH